MKRFGFLGAVLVAGSLMLTSCGQGSSANLGVVDMMQLMQSSQLQQLTQSMVTQDKDTQAKLKTAYDAMQAANAAASKAVGAAKAKAQSDAKAAQANFSTLMANFQKSQQSQQDQLKADVVSAIGTVAKAKGLSAVFVKQAVLYGNTTDITNDVITQIGKDAGQK